MVRPSKPDQFPDSDELGHMGESRFAEICSSAGLRATKSDRDRTGWDYIVAFKFDNPQKTGVTLDTRDFPISTHVQVKTVLTRTSTIRVRLTSAEWLAKEPKPSFFYVFKVDEGQNFKSGYLLHVQGRLLEKILKRLRQEEARENKKPNEVKISLNIQKYGKRLALTGSELRSALEQYCGADLAQYMASKQRELKTMGYDARPIELKADLHLDGIEDLVDAMLGLKGDIRATDLKTSTTRFGIKLPKDSIKDAILNITPTASDKCTVTVRSSRFVDPAVFDGETYFPGIPGLEVDDFKVRIECDALSIIANRKEYQITTKGGDGSQGVGFWIAYWKLAVVLASGDGRIEIASESKPISVGVDVNKATTGIDESECMEMLRLAEMAASLLRAAGVSKEPSVTNWLLQRVKSHIKVAYLVRNPGVEPVEVVGRLRGTEVDQKNYDFLFVGYVPFGTVTLVWYAVANLREEIENGEIVYKGRLENMQRLEAQRQFPAGYNEFIEAAKVKTGISLFQAMPMPRSSSSADMAPVSGN